MKIRNRLEIENKSVLTDKVNQIIFTLSYLDFDN